LIHTLQAEDLLDRDDLLADALDAAVGEDAGEDVLHGGHRGADRVIAVDHHLDLA